MASDNIEAFNLSSELAELEIMNKLSHVIVWEKRSKFCYIFCNINLIVRCYKKYSKTYFFFPIQLHGTVYSFEFLRNSDILN